MLILNIVLVAVVLLWYGFGWRAAGKVAGETMPAPSKPFKYLGSMVVVLVGGAISWYYAERELEKIVDYLEGFEYEPLIMEYHVGDLRLPYRVSRFRRKVE